MKFHRFGTKLTAWILSCALLLPYAPAYAHAAEPEAVTGETADGLVYSIKNGSATITGYTGASDTVHIPSEINDCPVQTIGGSAFSGCTNLTAVQYPSGLTDAESQGGVFRDCVNLHRIEIPNGVKTIHSNFFKESALQSVILPDSVTEIEHSAFFNCADLLYADIPASVKTMGHGIFEGCPHVTLYTEKRSAASVYAIDAGLPLVTTQTDAAFDRTVLTDDSAYTMEFSANGYAQFTINCAADETLWPETYWQELLIRLPTCVSLNESTLKLDGALCQNYVYDIDNRALTIPLEDRESPHAKVEFSVEITAQGDLSTYAALTYSRDSIRRTEYIDVINETMDRFTLRTEKIVSGSNIPVSGIAPAGTVVTLSVDDAVVGTATANRIGIYQSVLPIEETGENRAIRLQASCSDNAEALRKADELAADRTAFMLMATLLPLAMGGGPPGAMLSLMLMAMSAASNSFWDLRTTQIKGTSCNVRWKVDPSGHVYDAETGKPLAGVTTTAYWIEYDSESTEYTYEEFYAAKPAEDTYGTLWDNAVEWAETNPLVTDENGWYAWDVPEGWWRVQYEKEGYITAWSEWLPVLPIQADVDIWLVPTEPGTFSIRADERDGTSITVTATNHAAAADVRFILASYDATGKLLECRLTEQTLSASGSAALTLPLNEDADRVRAYLLDPTTCKPLRSDWHLNIL